MRKPEFISVGDGRDCRKIAVHFRSEISGKNDKGSKPGVVWLGGYRSDMAGSKAMALDQWAKSRGSACCRHDYSGHGQSEGEFIHGTISRWVEESLAVFDHFTQNRQLLVCSSMGAWIGLRMAQELVKRGAPNRLQGILLLAPAPDFTEELLWPRLTSEHKLQLEKQGYLEEPSQYSDEPDIFTRALFEDGKKNRLMKASIELPCAIHIIQGMQDKDVPYRHAMNLMTFLPDTHVQMTLVKDGDHRLSRAQDIELILRSIEALASVQETGA